MLKIGFFLFFFLRNFLHAQDFCEIKNIEQFDINFFNCNESQPLFGYLKFVSKNINFSYIFDDRYNIKIISDYHDEIINLINIMCSENKKIRLKHVTNFDKTRHDFKTTIILSCIYSRK